MDNRINRNCDIINDKIIGDTLEKLCVADTVQNYCTSCTSGNGCCAKQEGSSFVIDEQALFDAVNQLPKDVESFPEEVLLTTETVHTSSTEYTTYTSSQSKSYYMEEQLTTPRFEDGDEQVENLQTFPAASAHPMSPEEGEVITSDEEDEEEQRPVRRRVTIDLSKEGDLTDAEIIRRLLSSSDSLSSDEPLEVILEIVGEEEDSDCSDDEETPKTFQSLREKLRNSSFFTSSPKILLSDPNNSAVKTLPRVFEPPQKRVQDPSESWRSDAEQDLQSFSSPSYQKANSLINEIESCFMETANIVEKTLGAARVSNKQSDANKASRDGFSDETVPNNEAGDQITSKTIQEALHIFDSIMSDKRKSRGDNEKSAKIKRDNECTYNNSYTNNGSYVKPDKQCDKASEQFQENLCQPVSYERQQFQASPCIPNHLESDFRNKVYKSGDFLDKQDDDDANQYKSSEFSCFHLIDNDIRSVDDKYLSNKERNSYQNDNEENDGSKLKLVSEAFHYNGGNYSRSDDFTMTEENEFQTNDRGANYLDDDYEATKNPHNNISNNMQQLFWRNWQTGFERDVDELFRECYELSSTEPNNSLSSCLKNLENLSSQLREAKENILQEMIYEETFGNYNNSDHFGSQISLENKKKLALINELIEKKLKSKLKLEKFHVGPPLMGLEGRTHKVIAEVSPINSLLENELPPTKENVNIKSFLMDNENINIKRTFHNDIIENVISQENTDLHDSAFDSNSEISMATNSNSFGSLSQTESTSYSKMDGTLSKNSGGTYSTDEGINSILSHEETLALYEDNQELQQSLLSILHSLNDIHDNFLRRRQKEVDLSQQSSHALHENIKASIADKSYEFIDQNHHNCENNQFSYHQNDNYTHNGYSDQFLRSETMNDDFAAIEKIIKVSDELKNLWLFGADDLNSFKHRSKPSRSLSLNRYYRPKINCRNYSTHNSEDEFSETEDDEMTLNNEKSYSMPNLNSDDTRFPKTYDYTSENPSQIIQPNDLFVTDFNKRMKYENAKCYEVTLNFLKRIMEACKLLDDDDGQSQSLQETMKMSFAEFTSSQELFHQDHDQQSMASINMAAEMSRDYLMWCPDSEFDKSVADLDMRGLVDLVHTLQDAMAVEQQTFESLSKQLEGASDPLLQQRMSAALCTSQTRLARLCSRNMRCFSQQALKSRPRSGEPSGNIDSRSSSPRDSGFAVSSSGSDFESDIRSSSLSSASPPGISYGGASFKNSMAFFQKAANLVVATPKNSNKGGHVHREAKRSYRRSGSKHNQKTEQPFSVNQVKNPNAIELSRIEDTETYENVLFINGRPQYQEDSSKRSHSYDGYLDSRNSDNENRLSINSDYPNTRESRLSCPGATSTTIHITSGHSPRSRSSPNSKDYESSGSRTRVQILNDSAVDPKPPSRPVRLKDSIHSKSLSDVRSCISLPRRKPVLNFSSVADGASDRVNSSGRGLDYFNRGAESHNKSEQNRCYTNSSQIKRSHSFKEGLDFSYDGYSEKGSSNLCRTQSCCDGLADDLVHEKRGSKLSRAPSVDEILESVKTLRTKRSAMVKSSPDLLQQSPQEKNYSSSRNKNSSKKSSKSSSSSLVGVHFNGSVGTTTSSKSEKYGSDPHYYENVKGLDQSNQYENLPTKKVEVIYDRPTNNQKVEKRHKGVREPEVAVDHYENINFEPPVYENMSEDEPTYMNVSGKVNKRKSKSSVDQSSNLYANIEEASKSKSSKKNRQNDKNYVDSSHIDDDGTYDVPKSSTHIYDTPPKQTRQVCLQTSYNDEGTYDTPKNNRSILPQSTQMLLKVKKDQIKKIEDIFADCEKDSMSGGIKDISPDIPPPDYGVEGETIREVSRGKASSPPDYIDEGLGESDGRPYYADEQGLEVILEEPEDDYSSTHSSEEDLRRRLDLQLRLKGERRSLDGSEGIGSAEGDSHSSGSDIGAEDDCASSGIHSEDTSLGHPHIEPSREEFERTSRAENQSSVGPQKEEDQIPQQDRCVEVYPETLRQRQRNMAPSPSKVDIKNWENNSGGSDEDSKGGKKFLPSVKALRSQFENGKSVNRDVSPSPPPSISPPIRENLNNLGRTSSNSSTSSLVMSSLEASSGFSSLASSQATSELLSKSLDDEPVEPIFNQFHPVCDDDRDSMCQPPSTIGWNPQPLLKKMYFIPEAPKMQSQGTNYINIDGYLEKLPSGRKKATFWNAWKRRYFVAKDGTLYYYQNNQTEKPNMKLPLMGGKVEIMDQHMVNIDDGEKNTRSASMLGIDDGKGHYVVVRCPTRQEAERWKKALDTHTVEDFSSQYVQPWPRPTNPTLLRDTLIIDIGSCSVRAGVLASQPTLPQLFFPSVVATNRETRNQIWGTDALMPQLRTNSSVAFPIRPSHKISKFSVDLNSISSLLQKTFKDLKVDPKNYNIQLSVPKVLNQITQVELLKILFEKFGVKAVNLTHQSILALYAYNATSGIVVDIGERIDVVPVTDGYIVDGGVSRIPYGGYRILDHIRQFLFQRNLSLVNEVDSYVIRQCLETVCYSAQHYNTEKQRCNLNTESFEKTVPLAEFFPNTPQYEAFRNISLDFGRFQATEGLFNPDAWGLDHPGLQKLVHKAIQECSMDIRKEMSRSIFLSGGLSQLPGISERLTVELDNLTPPAIHPKVHSSPYRYHAAYIGACVLAESPAFVQSKITKEEWQKQGNSALRKWAL